MIRVISLGAGVQSTTVALMAAVGELEMPDCAIFADTGWEPVSVYRHLDWLETQLPFPVHRVSVGNIRTDYLGQAAGRRAASIPYFTSSGMKPRQCTAEYKVRPILRKIRELLGILGQRSPTESVAEQWIGISTDEAHRMKPSRYGWISHRYPLIDMRLSRNDCAKWLGRRGLTAPKSACIGCPFHSDTMWRDMRDNDPASWADAVAFDGLLRTAAMGRGFTQEAFMHRSCVPLDQVDLRTWDDRGQSDLFGNECEGMCGV